MVCGAKRILSLYLPWMTVVAPKLSTAAPAKCLASLSTINAAITPWRDVFAEQTSLPLFTYRGWKPLPQRSSSQTLQLGEEGCHLHDLATASLA